MTDNSNAQVIPKKVPWGVLLYEQPDGSIFSNDEGDPLYLEADLRNRREFIYRTERMAEAALSYGADEGGNVVFQPGKRGVTDSEYEDQMDAWLDGEEIPGDIDA